MRFFQLVAKRENFQKGKSPQNRNIKIMDSKDMNADNGSTGAEPVIIENVESNYDEIVHTFDALNLHDNLLRGIFGFGFEKPSAIQQRGIKPILDGFDTIGQAQSGTGKTATFVIGALQKINYEELQCQALILAPTRELAQQIQRVRRGEGMLKYCEERFYLFFAISCS